MQNLLFRFLGDATSFSNAAAQVQSGLGGISTTANVTKGIVAGVMAGIGTSAVYAAGQFEQTTIAYETMLGSVDETKKLLADLTEFAALTPFEMPEIQAAARGLVQFGERGDELMESLHILGNAAAGTSTNFGELALIFNQVRGVGKLLTQDFRQMSTRGVLSLQDIADHFDTTTEKAQSMLSAGRVSFEDLKGILRELSSDTGRFANLMEKQSQSFLGLVSTVKDEIGIEIRKVGEELLPMAKEIVLAIQEVVQGLGALPPTVKMTLVVMTGLATAGMALAASWGVLAMAAEAVLVPAITAVTVSVGALIAVVGAPVMAALSLAAGAALIYAGAVSNVNKEIERGIGLQKKFADLSSNQHEKEFSKIQKSDNVATAKIVTDDAFGRAMEEADGFRRQVNAASEALEKLRQEGYDGGDIEFREASGALAGLNLRYEEAVGYAEKLKNFREEIANLPPDAPPDPELVKGLRAYTDEIKTQIATVGMSKQQIKEYEYAQQKVGATLMNEVKQAHEELNRVTKNNNAKEYVNSLKEQLTTMNMTSNQLKEYKLAQEGVNGALQNEVKLLHQQIEAQQKAIEKRMQLKSLVESMKGSLQSAIQTPEQRTLDSAKQAGASPAQLAQIQQAQKLLEMQEKMKQSQAKAKQELEQYNSQLKSDANALKESLKEPWEKAGDMLARYKMMLKDGLITQGEFRQGVAKVAEQFTHTLQSARELNNYLAGTRQFNVSMEGIRSEGMEVVDVDGMKRAAMHGGRQFQDDVKERKELESKAQGNPKQQKMMEDQFKQMIEGLGKIVDAIDAQTSTIPKTPRVVETVGLS